MSNNRLNGSSLFLQAISGLTSNYGYLSGGEGLTIEKLKNPNENINKNALNPQFTSFLATNFAKFDTNQDGEIKADELQNYTNNLSKNGMTMEELYQLCSQSGGTNSLLETVIANFNEIDKNHDGKVSNDEISAFGINKEIDEMKTAHPKFDPGAMSIFYSTDATDEDA